MALPPLLFIASRVASSVAFAATTYLIKHIMDKAEERRYAKRFEQNNKKYDKRNKRRNNTS